MPDTPVNTLEQDSVHERESEGKTVLMAGCDIALIGDVGHGLWVMLALVPKVYGNSEAGSSTREGG